MHRFLLLTCLALLLGLSSSQAQQRRVLVEQISTEEGLSNRFVRSILQDSKGFMWVGTKIGLNRYDGYNFKVFSAKNSALQSDYIEEIWEDADSNLWLGHGLNNELNNSFETIDILNINTFAVQSLQDYLGKSLPVPIKDIYRIYNRTGSKDLYLATTRGQVFLYKGQGKFELFYDQQQPVRIQDLWFGKKYTWICSSNKILAINKEKEVIYEYLLTIPSYWQGDFFAQLDSTTLLLSINDGFNVQQMWEWHAAERQLVRKDTLALFGQNKALNIDVQLNKNDQTGFQLFYSRLDFNLYDPDGQLLYNQDYEKVGKRLRVVYIDRQENIWLGVSTKGLIKVSTPKKRFDVYLEGISTRAIIARENPNELIVGSYSGRYVINTISKKERYIDTLTDNAILTSAFGKHLWVVQSPTLRRTGHISLKQLQAYEYKKEAYKERVTQSGVDIKSVWALHEDTNGRVWLGMDNGLGYLDPAADSLEMYQTPAPHEALNTSVIYDFHENKVGLWVAASTGLYVKRAADNQWQHYSRQQEPPYQLPYDYLFDINEDSRGFLWLATRGGGVLRLNPTTGACRQWTKREGLSHDVVYATLEGKHGYIWMSSNKGLMRMDSATYLINTYLPEDGLSHEEFNRKSSYKHPNGHLYFGGLSGIVGFNPSDFLDTMVTVPPFHITRYQYFDGDQSKLLDATDALTAQRRIDLNYNDRFFIVELALLDFNVNAHKTYAYQIEGLQEDWIFTKDPNIRVDGLRPGQYTLRVKAELSSSSWSPILLELPILVRAPFYFQWPFIVILVLLLLLSFFLYTRWRERNLYQANLLLEKRVSERTKTIEEQAAELRELDEMKTRFFANISHELRTPLTLILGPVEAALNQNQAQLEGGSSSSENIQPLLHLIRRHGLKLKQLIEQILSLSKLEANQLALEERPQNLAGVLRSLWSNFEAQAELQGVEWILDQEISTTLQVWMDADKLEKIINNLLSNALKHTPKGERVGMSTRWDLATRCLYLNVNDTGKGIPAEDVPHIFKRFYQTQQGKTIGGTGIGLALASELAQLMGGDIQVASIMGTGSTFMLTIPFKIINEEALEYEDALEDFSLPLPSSNKAASLLIVEDLLDMRLFLGELLSQFYTIKTAANGQLALDILEQENHGIDLVISDVMMPVMDGFELLGKIKEKPQHLQVPVIMLTARTAERDKLKALRIGVDDYLQKPFSNRELLARVNNLLEHYQQRQQWMEEQQGMAESTAGQTGTATEKEAIEIVTDPWTENLEEVAKREVGNTQFNMAQLAYDLNLSERQLRRKIKAKTGLTPNQYFRCIKLDVARDFLETRRYQTVAEVAHKVGFSNVHYFSKLYLAQYGKKPIDYLR